MDTMKQKISDLVQSARNVLGELHLDKERTDMLVDLIKNFEKREDAGDVLIKELEALVK